MLIVPFRLQNAWMGLDIDSVKGVEACGQISLLPNIQSPNVGLMQKNGKILPVWSLFTMVNGKKEDVLDCIYFIEVNVQNKSVAIPVDEVLSVVTAVNSWVPVFKYGIKMYRSLDKKAPQNTESVQSISTESAVQEKDFQEIY